eukprot:gnl/Chilomastix_cuspidata/214.p1 GENE.gnl/Chilomastix_cuspidata/214~~gnl/Chilomastix_cuspidata/214.p1  ORF type:complete len:441 (+),score=171.45 gnl/Chilomastix_cuspidata/214:462-1784(+)
MRPQMPAPIPKDLLFHRIGLNFLIATCILFLSAGLTIYALFRGRVVQVSSEVARDVVAAAQARAAWDTAGDIFDIVSGAAATVADFFPHVQLVMCFEADAHDALLALTYAVAIRDATCPAMLHGPDRAPVVARLPFLSTTVPVRGVPLVFLFHVSGRLAARGLLISFITLQASFVCALFASLRFTWAIVMPFVNRVSQLIHTIAKPLSTYKTALQLWDTQSFFERFFTGIDELIAYTRVRAARLRLFRSKFLHVPVQQNLQQKQPLSRRVRKAKGTVLFACTSGDTAAKLKWVEAACMAVQANGGAIDKMGDGTLMAFWLRTHPQTDGRFVARACYAAIKLREAAENLELGMFSCGIHSGSLLAGIVGSKKRRSFTVLGPTVNLASRLQGICEELGTTIVISEDAARFIGPCVLTESLGSVEVAGKDVSIAIRKIVGSTF